LNPSQIERLLIEYSNIPERKKELEIKTREAQLLIQNAEDTLRVPSYDGLPHGNLLQDAVYKAVQKILDEYQIHLDYYQGQLKLLNEKERAVYEALKCLEPHEYKIIELRYIRGYMWKTVSIKVNYHRVQCIRIRDKAIEKIKQSYRDESN